MGKAKSAVSDERAFKTYLQLTLDWWMFVASVMISISVSMAFLLHDVGIGIVLGAWIAFVAYVVGAVRVNYLEDMQQSSEKIRAEQARADLIEWVKNSDDSGARLLRDNVTLAPAPVIGSSAEIRQKYADIGYFIADMARTSDAHRNALLADCKQLDDHENDLWGCEQLAHRVAAHKDVSQQLNELSDKFCALLPHVKQAAEREEELLNELAVQTADGILPLLDLDNLSDEDLRMLDEYRNAALEMQNALAIDGISAGKTEEINDILNMCVADLASGLFVEHENKTLKADLEADVIIAKIGPQLMRPMLPVGGIGGGE